MTVITSGLDKGIDNVMGKSLQTILQLYVLQNLNKLNALLEL